MTRTLKISGNPDRVRQARRRYRLHYNLRRSGHTIVTRERWVTRKSATLSDIEKKWLNELIELGYCVGDSLFPPNLEETK